MHSSFAFKEGMVLGPCASSRRCVRLLIVAASSQTGGGGGWFIATQPTESHTKGFRVSQVPGGPISMLLGGGTNVPLGGGTNVPLGGGTNVPLGGGTNIHLLFGGAGGGGGPEGWEKVQVLQLSWFMPCHPGERWGCLLPRDNLLIVELVFHAGRRSARYNRSPVHWSVHGENPLRLALLTA